MTATASQAPAFKLTIPPPRVLTTQEELIFARKAVEKDPESVRLRYLLGSLLVLQDEFDEAIERLRAWDIEEHRFLHLLIDSLLSRTTPEADREVEVLCQRALAVSYTELERTHSYATLAKVQLRLGQREEARRNLQEALDIYPANKNAYKRSASVALHQDQPDEVLERAAQLAGEGVIHSRIIASQSLALAQLDRMDEARAMQGLDRFLTAFEPAPPDGWATLEEFNQALAQEVHGHPDIRYNRYGTASAHTWRIDKPALQRSRLIPALQAMIQREVDAYVAQLPQSDHPFLRSAPETAGLQNWCVITEGDGHETWHVHQNGWLSGVYYIYVQDHISQGTGPEGCISFGLPEEILGAEGSAKFGERLCRPRTGLMMLFPSHTYHRTYPHHGDGRRICYAFDIVPGLGD